MLGKLLKYEFKSSARMLPIVYLAIAVFYLFGLLAKALSITPMIITSSIVLAVGAVAAIIMTLVTVILRFFKGLFGSEGYLTQTLPVSKGSLIAAKVINAYIWMAISAVIAVLAFLAIFQINRIDQLNMLFDYLKNSNFAPVIIYVLLACCIQLLAFLGELFFAITLSNTRPFLKNNVLFSIVFYFVSYTVVDIIGFIAILFVPLGIRITNSGASWTTESMFHAIGLNFNSQPAVDNFPFGIGSLLVELTAGIVLLLLARWLMTHKTSVK